MAFLAGLLSFGLLLALIDYLFNIPLLAHWQDAARIAAAIMFVLIGFMHLRKPQQLTYMIEGMLPYPTALVIFSGVLEILLGAGLLFPATQYWSAWGLIILLVLMFPANIRVAVAGLPAPGGLPAKAWYTWSRLLFQPVYIWWIWWSAISV